MFKLIKGYQGSYNELFSANKKDGDDPFNGEISNTKYYFVKNLENVYKSYPGKIAPLLSQLPNECQNHLKRYLAEANIILQ